MYHCQFTVSEDLDAKQLVWFSEVLYIKAPFDVSDHLIHGFGGGCHQCTIWQSQPSYHFQIKKILWCLRYQVWSLTCPSLVSAFHAILFPTVSVIYLLPVLLVICEKFSKSVKNITPAGSAWLGQGLGTKVLAWNKQRQEWSEKTICKRQEDHGDMEMDINETKNAGMKDETRGTGMNGGVLEMWWKYLRVSYWGHKISKLTSVDCNKIYVVTV